MGRGRILIVDDEADVCEVVSRVLRTHGFETDTAPGAEAALAAASAFKPDLVLTDIKMPGGDGLWLAGAIKKAHPDIAVVMMTGHASVDTAIEALRLGVDDYIMKPFDLAQGVASIRAALENRQTTIRNKKYVEDLEQGLLDAERKPAAGILASIKSLFDKSGDERCREIETLESLVHALGESNPATKDHSRKVAAYALEMASHLGLSSEDKAQCRLAGLLHDIGKIGIPHDVAIKPVEEMTEVEFEQYKEHPAISCRILQPVREFEPILGAVLHHHERFDGSGFPDGLSGEQIPLGARAIAVADCAAYADVATAHDDTLHEAFVVEALMSGRGTRFDPDMVDIMITVLRSGKI